MQKISTLTITALCVAAFAGRTDAEVVVSEDFSLFTAGSETTPDAKDINVDWYVPSSFTHQPNWPGGGVFQAGGVCLLGPFTNGYDEPDFGFISTPVMELFGDITISFRARKQETGESSMWLAFCNDNEGPVQYFYPELTTEWKSFTYTIQSREFYAPCNVQFTAEDGNIFIDDIVIDRVKNVIKSPTALPATNLSLTEFEANWEPTSAPDHLLSVYYNDTSRELASGSMKEDFSKLPASSNATLTTEDYQSGPSALLLSKQDDYVEIGPTPYPIDSFSLWVKPVNGQTYSDSMISISVWQNGKWELMAQYSCAFLGQDYLRVFDKDAIGEGASKIRIEYKYYTDDDVAYAIDDLNIVYREEPDKIYVLKDEPVSGTSKKVSGINPEADYFYFLQAREGEILSDPTPKVWVDGINGLKVTALDATLVESNGFTANWESLPHASEYAVTLQRVIDAKEDMPGTVLLEEDFSKITEGDFSDPGSTYEPQINLGDNDMANTGWVLTNPCWVKGMAGSFGTTWYGTAGLVVSPRISLNNDGGKFTVEATVYSPYGSENIWVMLLNDINDTQSFAGKAIEVAQAGYQSGTVTFDSEGRENVLVAFMSQSTRNFFVDDVKIIQDIHKGDKVTVPYNTLKSDANSLAVKDLADASAYIYSVRASREKAYVGYTSDESDPIYVKLAPSGIDEIAGASGVNIAAAAGAIMISSDTAVGYMVTDLAGRVVASGSAAGQEEISAAPGVYIVKAGKAVAKVIVK